jgi:4-hydroxybenzoate polyprenyltransferase
MNTRILLIKQLRPKQWTKNLLVFAALIFSIEKFKPEELFRMGIHTFIGFLLFSFVAGCVYIINDYMDIDADKKHPEKKSRPLASGELNPKTAFIFGTFLLFVSLVESYFLNPMFALILAIYFLLNVAYSLWLKNEVIIDVMVVATGFVLRAIAGGIIIHVPFTPWFLLCTMLLALFLAIGKRRHELVFLQEKKGSHRKVLEKYSVQLLDQMISIVTCATIICYSLFTFDKNIMLMWTIPFVIYGVFRYMYLIHIEGRGGKPDKILFQDKQLLSTVLLYAITSVIILINL